MGDVGLQSFAPGTLSPCRKSLHSRSKIGAKHGQPLQKARNDYGSHHRKESQNSIKKWWGQYKDALGRLKRVPLAIDKLSAQAKLNELVKKVEREMAGLVDPTDEQRKRPMQSTSLSSAPTSKIAA